MAKYQRRMIGRVKLRIMAICSASLLVVLVGCGSSPQSDEDQIQGVIAEWADSMKSQDWEAACSLYSPKSLYEAELDSPEVTCEELLEEDYDGNGDGIPVEGWDQAIDEAANVLSVDISGSNAAVETLTGTWELNKLDGKWRFLDAPDDNNEE